MDRLSQLVDNDLDEYFLYMMKICHFDAQKAGFQI